MAKLRDERRRLDGLLAAIERNRGGLDLSRLNDDQRAAYDDYRNRCAAFAASFDEPDAAYTAMIDPDGSGYPRLRRDVYRILFDQVAILATDTAAIAGEKYQRLIR